MTADDAIDAALARCTDLGLTVPSARSVAYRRLGIRQGQLFSRIATTYPDYLGRSAPAVLSGGAFSLATLAPGVERVTDVRVLLPGSSGLTVGDRVNLILLDDADAMLPPRATIRDQELRGIENDLTGVTSLTIHYARRPSVTTILPATPLELPEQFQDLLVIDLARQMIGKLLDVEPTRREGFLTLLGSEESSLLQTLDDHVRHFVYGEQRRFRPAGDAVPGADNG